MIQLTPPEHSIVYPITSLGDDLAKTLRVWSGINSGSYNDVGLKSMRESLADYMADLPGDMTFPALAQGEVVSPEGQIHTVDYAPAILLTVRPHAPVQVVLTGHYDTVFPADSRFQTPVRVDDDTLNGPGVADMKGGILVMLNALRALEKSGHAGTVGYNVLLSPDEEIGSPGSAPLLAKLGKKSDIGLTYEPALADGSLAGARKGSGNFALIVRGRAAHAGREHHLGRNAIAALSEFIMGMEALNGQRDYVTFNIAKIDGGGASNIVPDLAVGRFNVRMKESEDMAWIDENLARLVAELNAKDGITAQLTGGFTRPPKPMAPANRQLLEWVRDAGSAIGQKINWLPSGGVCEGNNLWASGCPNVDTLGVCGGNIHSGREFIRLSSLVERIQLSTLILVRIASGAYDAKKLKDMAQQSRNGASAC